MANHSKTHREIRILKSSKLTEELVYQFDHLLDYASPQEFSNTLIEIYHVYLIHEHETLPLNFKEMANHVFMIINFLRMAQKQIGGAASAKLQRKRN